MQRIACFASFRGLIVLLFGLGIATTNGLLAQQTQPATPPATKSAAPLFKPEEMDALLAPVALYPDQLLAQIFMCAESPYQIGKLAEWLALNQSLKGSAAQEAAQAAGFDPSYVALALFPQVVQMMAEKPDWTKQLDAAFARDRAAVFDSVQRLRNQAHQVGNLKTTPQQEVRTQTTQTGQQVIVIEPANPQIVYVPQYNPQVVYTQAPAPTTIVVQEDDDDDELAAGLIGFTAGIAIGAVSNPYYYGPYGWHGGGGYMYAEAWDDYYDHREDAREDWMEHREDMGGDRSERQGTRQEERTQRQDTREGERTQREGTRQEERTQRQDSRSGDRTERASTRQQGASTSDRAGSGASAATRQQGATRDTARVGSGTYESRGYGSGSSSRSVDRSGSSSGAFSGYSSGSSSRSASSRGQSSRSSSGSRGGGGRGGGGRGGGRRR